MIVEKKKLNKYLGKVGCWNCSNIYKLSIKKGENTAEYIERIDPPCTNCGCRELKAFDEYRIEKDILKDLILQHRMEQITNDVKSPDVRHDHQHIG